MSSDRMLTLKTSDSNDEITLDAETADNESITFTLAFTSEAGTRESVTATFDTIKVAAVLARLLPVLRTV